MIQDQVSRLIGTIARRPAPSSTSPLRLIDLSLSRGTLGGLQVLMQPTVQTKEDREGGLIWLRLHPDTVLTWLNSAAADLTVPVPNGPPGP